MIHKRSRRNLPYHLMLLPALVIVVIYCYVPMIGALMAFEDFKPRGFMGFFTSPWVGLKHFRYFFGLDATGQIIFNTIYISLMKMVLGVAVPVFISILLNELRTVWFKRTIQTFVYLPNFMSWVVLAGIMVDILSPSDGIVNNIIRGLTGKTVPFLMSPAIFPYTLVWSDVWQRFGFLTVVYIAAITGIDPALYEACKIDGAGYIKQMWHITLPGMMSIIVLMSLLSLGNLLNAGFEQVLNLINPAVQSTGEIIDTYVYKLGILDARYSLATAVGLFKSVVSVTLISLSYWLAYKFADYRIF